MRRHQRFERSHRFGIKNLVQKIILKNSKFPVASFRNFWFINGVGSVLVPFPHRSCSEKNSQFEIMRYFIPLLIVVLFTGHCFGLTPGQSSSTNLLAAVKASTNQPVKWDGTITLGLTATAGNVNSVLATSKIASERKTAHNDLSLGADGAYG